MARLDLNQLIKENYKFWKIYQAKYVLFAIGLLNGAKNGKFVGRKLNTVQIDAEIRGYQYESNINHIPKSNF